MRRIEKRIPILWIVMSIGFGIGVLYGNVRYHAGEEIGILFSPSYIATLAEGVAMDFAYAFRVLRSRALPALFFWILGRGKWQWIFRDSLMMWVGWLFGMTLVSAVTQQGAFGILLYLAMLFPHFLFYGVAYSWLFRHLQDSASLEENPKAGGVAVFYFAFGCLWEICILPSFLGILCG